MGPVKTHIDGVPILEYLTKKWETKTSEYVRMPIYQLETYLDIRERYDRQLGIEFDRAAYVQSLAPPAVPEEKGAPVQPHTPVTRFDWVYTRLRYTDSGRVRVKLLSKMFTIYEKYYARGQRPPSDALIDAYKEHGYTREFLRNTIQKIDHNSGPRKALFGRAIARVFPEPKAKKKTPKKKKEETVAPAAPSDNIEEMFDNVTDDDEDENEDDEDDDGAFDMEEDEDEPETNEEEIEDEFIDDE